jgi:hypothetical protein
MLINDQTLQQLNSVLDKIELDKNETDENNKKIARIKFEIRAMSKHSKSIQRSGNEKRIGEFNIKFIKALSELSRLIQTTGQSNRDEAVRLVKEIKSK